MLRMILLCAAIFCAFPGYADARSASSPKHTGIEPPGGPRQAPIPTMGYTDAYGNGLTDKMPEERKPRHRPRAGAYGGPVPKESHGSLPDTGPVGDPVWKFR